MKKLPTAAELIADPCASDWLKTALRSAINRDAIDAAGDAELLAAVLKFRADTLIPLPAGNRFVLAR